MGISLKGVEQPPGTLLDVFPGFSRFENELAVLGQDTLTTRAATLARMSAPELVAAHESAKERSRYIRSTMADLSSELQLASREISETMMFLSLHRLYDLRRAPLGSATPGPDMPDDGKTPHPDTLLGGGG